MRIDLKLFFQKSHMKYEQVKELDGEKFRRLTGFKRATFFKNKLIIKDVVYQYDLNGNMKSLKIIELRSFDRFKTENFKLKRR